MTDSKHKFNIGVQDAMLYDPEASCYAPRGYYKCSMTDELVYDARTHRLDG